VDCECERSGIQVVEVVKKLEVYDYEIVFKRGVANTNSDALSRVSQLAVVTRETETKKQIVTDEETKNTILYE